MKWKESFSSGFGAFLLYAAWHVFEGGRVLTRSGYSSMTRESNPVAFCLEVASLTFIGAALLAYGLAGLLGYSVVTTKMDSVANQIPVLKLQTYLICALVVLLVAGLGWLVADELMRTSRLRPGGG